MKISKYQVNLKSLVFNNFWLKIISFVLAVITWLWASGELASGISGIRI
ncbi:MAG: hypothetical protein JXD21_03930 [Candidatus Omnitrophica bacterium]|nr:hypothetical protein [Candidatus Omnitrophota bacterium]